MKVVGNKMKLNGKVCNEFIYVYFMLVFNFNAYARVRVVRNYFSVLETWSVEAWAE